MPNKPSPGIARDNTIRYNTKRIMETREVPVLGLALLGLVHERSPCSGYDLRKVFAQTPMGTYSDSPGAIYPALRRLEKSGLIRGCSEPASSVRKRQLYRATPRGEAALRTWLAKPVETEDLIRRMGELSLRFAFMESVLGRRGCIVYLQSLLSALKSYVPVLQEHMKMQRGKMPLSASLALRCGIMGYQNQMAWARLCSANISASELNPRSSDSAIWVCACRTERNNMQGSVTILGRPVCLLTLLLALNVTSGQTRPDETRANSIAVPPLLVRQYSQGEEIMYHMIGSNQGDRYEAQASGLVRFDSNRKGFEEIEWSHLMLNGKPLALPAASAAFRQRLSLDPDPDHPLSVPDLSQVHPSLIGPITDLLTFYADWQVASQSSIRKPGDRARVPLSFAPSWADGCRVILGEDSIEFDITLNGIDTKGQVATILVRHVPPAKPLIKIPVEWMRVPVADTPNNWVEVTRQSDGTYAAAIGKETFDVEMKIDLPTGRIISGTLVNVVEVSQRTCTDATLTKAGDPIRFQIKRNIEIR